MSQFFIVLSVVWLAVISPGADFAMVSRTSAVEGRRAGLMVAAGVAAACWLHIAYAAFGLALLSRTFPNLLDVVRLIGAAYLIYMGVGMALKTPAPPAPAASETPSVKGGRAFARGLLTNALNPKTAIFIISLYAQVGGADASSFVKLGYGAVISLSHLIWFGAVAVFLSQAEVRRRVLQHRRKADIIIGGALVLLGVALALYDMDGVQAGSAAFQ